MSVDRWTYLGPYVEAHHRKPATIETTRRGCTNVSCGNHPTDERDGFGGGAFCAECGSAIGLVTLETDEPRTQPYDVVGDELTDADCMAGKDDGVMRLHPNAPRKGESKDRTLTDEDDWLALDLVDVDTHAEMAWMAKAYA